MKLYRGQRVKIRIKKEDGRKLKGHGLEAIVEKVNEDMCSLLVMDKEPYAIAWYDEDEVTLIDYNDIAYKKDIKILEKYEEENDDTEEIG